MNKNVLQVSAILGGVGILIGMGFVLFVFRGAGPALFAPAYDITDQIPLVQTSTISDSSDVLPEPDIIPQLPDSDFAFDQIGSLFVPSGMELEVYATDIRDARDIIITPKGTLLVSQPSLGQVSAVIDDSGEARAVVRVIGGLDDPHGLVMDCDDEQVNKCWMYVGDRDGVYRMQYNVETDSVADREMIFTHRTDGRHWRKTMVIAPYEGEKKLFVKLASSCDVCFEEDEYRATVMIMDLDGANERIFARGLRNAAFMTVHPVTGQIWVTEMGRDNLGDDLPPDEINIVVDGGNYGWPICYGDNVHDISFDKRQYIQDPCQDMISPHITMQAHSAPLGLEFIPSVGWPESWQGDLLVAYHGSWNRSEPTGYKIVKYSLDVDGNAVGRDDFVSGWLDDGRAAGRPVDMVFDNNGFVYITDDKAGVIYRLGF